MALVLAPERPLDGWLHALDAEMKRSQTFFRDRPVIIDLSGLSTGFENIPALINTLVERDIRIIGVEGADGSWPGEEVWGRPPMAMSSLDRAVQIPVESKLPLPRDPPALLVDRPVRSGQSVVFEAGDITIIGSVASGAEIIAGGSIHIYGVMRGRGIAGLANGAESRIFCQRLEAELLAIDGIYQVADNMDEKLRGRAVQVWLQDGSLAMAPLE
jgi:septum site-determining protein MinC